MKTGKSSIRIKSQFKITGYGLYLPPAVETAEELAPKINKTPQWIISRAGVKERRVSQIDVDEMGAIAARKALGSETPDLILNASGVGKQVIPDSSVFIQKELGFEGIPCFSIHATCLSFLVALNTAALFIEQGAYNKILIVSSDRGTRGRNYNEPESAALLGDAAAAILIESGLSFLGIGAQPPVSSWGAMIKNHYNYIILGKPYLAIAPGVCIMLLVMSFMLLGNALRAALDVRR